MIHTERDKRIAEALGVELHRISEIPSLKSVKFECGCCGYRPSHCVCVDESITKLQYHCDRLNPDFSTFDGMGLILMKGPERAWWDKFFYEDLYDYTGYVIRGDLLKLLQDPNKLADELETFLKEGR